MPPQKYIGLAALRHSTFGVRNSIFHTSLPFHHLQILPFPALFNGNQVKPRRPAAGFQPNRRAAGLLQVELQLPGGIPNLYILNRFLAGSLQQHKIARRIGRSGPCYLCLRGSGGRGGATQGVLAEKAPYFLAGAEILVRHADDKKGTRPGMSATDDFVMLHGAACIAAAVHGVFGRAAVGGIDIGHIADDGCRVAIVEFHPGIHQVGSGDHGEGNAVVGHHVVGRSVNFHHWHRACGVAGGQFERRHAAGHRGDGGNSLVEFAGQGITHKTAIAHAGRINALRVDVERGRQCIDQVADKSYIVDRSAIAECIPKTLSLVVEGAVGVHHQEIGRIGNAAKIAVKLLLEVVGTISVHIDDERNGRVAGIGCRFVKPVFTREAAALDGANDVGLGYAGRSDAEGKNGAEVSDHGNIIA